MADYNRLGTSVSTYENILDALLSFLTAAGPGPAWVEDASYPNSANAGQLFIRNAGATTGYVAFEEVTVGGNAVLQAFWVPGAANGYGGGTGATAKYSEEGCGFFADFTRYDYVLDQYADEERSIAVLIGTLKTGLSATKELPETVYQTLYFGEYTPGDSTNDTYPLAVLGDYTYLLGANDIIDGYEGSFFPEAMAKATAAAGTKAKGFHRGGRPGASFEVLYDESFKPPLNSYGGEAFAYQQQVFLRWPGGEYAFSLTGMWLSSADVGLEQDVAIGGADYRSYPSLATVWGSEPQPNGPYSVYLIPKGTAI